MADIWFTSDLHLGHANIIKYTGRPFFTGIFPDVEMMDEQLIANWNNNVGDRDTVYVLGDFCFWHTKKVTPASYFNRLKGRKILIAGNHDKKETLRLPWAELYEHGQAIIKMNGIKMTLNHCSMQTWIDSHKGAWHMFGHSHGEIAAIGRSAEASVDGVADYYAARREPERYAKALADYRSGRAVDGVPQPSNFARAWHIVARDLRLAQDYRPQNFEEMRERLDELPFIGVDGHGNR
jgi:calcineurin-like phosphoesterase family protein